MLFVESSDLDIFFSPFPDAFLFIIGERFDDFGGHPEDKGTRGNNGVFSDHCSGSNNGTTPDDRPIQDCCFHADEAFIFDGAGVDHGKMSNGDVLSDVDPEIVGKVENTPILDIGAFSNHDLFDVAADDTIWPDGGLGPKCDGPDDDRTLRHVGAGVDFRSLRQKVLEAIYDIHGKKVPLLR